MPWLLIGLFVVVTQLAARSGGAASLARPAPEAMRGTRSANLAMLLRLAFQLHRLYRQSKAAGGASRMMHRASEVEAARTLLGVPVGASRQQINAAYRDLMRRHHPDQGGSAEAASRLNRARDCLLAA